MARPWAEHPPALAQAKLGKISPQLLVRHGLVGLTALIPLQRATVVAGVGSAVTIAALVVIPLAFWVAVSSNANRRLLSGATILPLALTWWAGLTYFWSVAPEATAAGFIRLVPIVAMALALAYFADSGGFRLRLLKSYILGAVAASTLVIWQYFTAPGARRFSITPDASTNQVAFTLVLAVIPATYILVRVLRESPSPLWRLVLYAVPVPLIVIAVLLSGSRSAAVLLVIAVIAALLIIFFAAPSRKSAAKSLAALLLLGLGLSLSLSIPDARPLERIAPQAGFQAYQDAGRVELRSLAWARAADHPLLGSGLQTRIVRQLGAAIVSERSPHDTHVQVLQELGMVGAAIWGLLLLSLLGIGWRQPLLERLMWTGQLSILIIGLAARGFLFGVPMWFFIGLVLALANSSKQVAPR